jgi:hypothetical protein
MANQFVDQIIHTDTEQHSFGEGMLNARCYALTERIRETGSPFSWLGFGLTALISATTGTFNSPFDWLPSDAIVVGIWVATVGSFMMFVRGIVWSRSRLRQEQVLAIICGNESLVPKTLAVAWQDLCNAFRDLLRALASRIRTN